MLRHIPVGICTNPTRESLIFRECLSLKNFFGLQTKSVTSYRTEISGTTKDEMFSWIEDLKKDGYKFQDFYEMGMSEQDMLDMNG